MNNERKTFHETNLRERKRVDNLKDLTSSNSNFYQFPHTTMDRLGNQVYNSYNNNLYESEIENSKKSSDHEDQVSSTVKLFTPKVSTPFILPPPKVVGPQTRSFKKKQNISNNRLKEATQRPLADDEKHLDSVVPENDSVNELNDKGHSKQSDRPGEKEAIHAEDTEIVKENVSMEQRSNESFSGEESVSEEMDDSSENSIDNEFALMKEEPASKKEEEISIVPEDELTNPETIIEGKNNVENQWISADSEQESTILKDQLTFEYPEESSLSQEESSSLQEDSSSFQEESSSLQEVSSSFQEESSSLQEESSSSQEESSSFQDESSFSQGNSSSLQEVSSSFQEEPSSMTDESSSSQDESFSITEESFSSQEESSSLQEDSFSSQEKTSPSQEESSSQEESLTILEKISSTLEESSSIQDHMEEERLENCHHKLQKPSIITELPKKDPLPIVKLPVILAKMEIDIEIFDSFNLIFPLTRITKIDWSIHSLESRVLLPSNTVFLKGVLLANIEYVNEKPTPSFHTSKLQVPWQKTINVNWIYPPLMSYSGQEEFMFDDGSEISTHHLYQEQFADQIQHHLQSMNFIWHEQLHLEEDTPKLFIEGSANLAIDLLQPQYIDLNCI